MGLPALREPVVSYSCTMLNGVNKAGVLKPDENGYYELILGAFDFDNSVGQVYPAHHAKQFFEENHVLMRRANNGYLRGEFGHPKRAPGMSNNDFLTRIARIEETRISHHIMELELRYIDVKGNGVKIPCVIGKVKPSGPYGKALQESLNNKCENVAFSIRSITVDKWIGNKLHKYIEEIYTWDFVVEPGISIANKFQSPSLESIIETRYSIEDLKVVQSQLSASNDGMESAQQIHRLITRMEEIQKHHRSGDALSSW